MCGLKVVADSSSEPQSTWEQPAFVQQSSHQAAGNKCAVVAAVAAAVVGPECGVAAVLASAVGAGSADLVLAFAVEEWAPTPAAETPNESAEVVVAAAVVARPYNVVEVVAVVA